MPEIKTYVVRRTEEVTVAANDAMGAALVANLLFEGKMDPEITYMVDHSLLPEGVWGEVRSRPEIVSTLVEKRT
jgi:hypothetical protein